MRRSGTENGTASLELVILAPFVLGLMMMIIAFGRFAQTEGLVDQASRDGARAATAQNDKSDVKTVVAQAMRENLAGAPSSCRDSATADAPSYVGRAFELPDPSRPDDIATVTITVHCVLDLSDLGGLLLPSVNVTRTFTSPLDRYRGYQQ